MERNNDSVYSNRVKAGKRRTYFFDVKATRGNDYYLVLTESIKRFDDRGYDRHKLFIYKEDFNKFIKGLNEAVDFVKTELMPNFDFDAYNNDYYENQQAEATNGTPPAEATEVTPEQNEELAPVAQPEVTNSSTTNEEVDKW